MSRLAWIIGGLLIATTTTATAELTVGPRRQGSCLLFEHRDMQGARFRMANGERLSFARGDVGNSSWREVPSWNDVVSSAKLDAGCRLQVWEHMLAGGAAKTWAAKPNAGLNVNYVGDAWNDRVSSAVCSCN